MKGEQAVTDPALVDILLPVFNAEATIAEALESVRCQTVTSLRIIVIDDGSTDATPSILARFAERDPRITVLAVPNGGIVTALNAGLDICRGEFVARQDADDVSDPARLAMQLAYLHDHPDCVAVSGAVRHIDEGGRPLGSIQKFPSPMLADARWAPSREPYLCHPFLVARRSALERIGLYRHVHHSEDTDLYWRLAGLGLLHNLDLVLGSYRLHGASISGASIAGGRIMALSSQLAALSARRRADGRPDIPFERERLEAYRRAASAEGIFQLGREGLDLGEARYLRIAMAAKLLELTSYRPFELDLDDCLFVREARRERGGLNASNRAEFDRRQAGAAARLLGKGLVKEAAILAPTALYPSVALRMAAMAFPRALRRAVRALRARGRQSSFT
jgi:GT2 family glycosyltransferase